MRQFHFALFFIISYWTSAQTGWDFLKQGNHVEARNSFEEKLKNDSLDQESIQGMILLNDIEGRTNDQYEYIDRLVNHHYSDHYYNVYHKSCRLSQDFLSKRDLPYLVQIGINQSEAYNLKHQRKFAESQEKLNKCITHLDWSLTGPFRNINGAGHELVYPPENERFDSTATFTNLSGIKLGWVKPVAPDPSGEIVFKSHLMTGEYGSVYYANTFFKLDQGLEFTIGIKRKYPIKIWIDDSLVFSHNESITAFWDQEKISLALEKGTHKILVKYSVGKHHDSVERYTDTDWQEELGNHGLNYRSRFWGYFSEFSTKQKGKKNKRKYISVHYPTVDLAFRFLDKKNDLLNIPKGKQGDYIKKPVVSQSQTQETIRWFKKSCEEKPEQWFNFYMLVESSKAYGRPRLVEEYILKKFRNNSDSPFFKFLISRIYSLNGKRERSYEVMSGIDQSKSPIYTVLYKEFKDIDEDNDSAYLPKLNQLLSVSKGNLELIKDKLEHLDKNGKKQEKTKFAKAMIDEYPNYKRNLEKYLKEDNKPRDYDIGWSERSKKIGKKYSDKKGKKARKRIKEKYWNSDYDHLRRIYKGEKEEEKVIALYDEQIQAEPHKMSHRQDKAEYLYNLEKYEPAIDELNFILKNKPYDHEVLELIGDILVDSKKDTSALEYYLKSSRLSGEGSLFSSWGSSYSFRSKKTISQKIERITGPKQWKKHFEGDGFEEWKTADLNGEEYANEESVILGFNSDILMEEDGQIHMFGKMLIKILTEAGANSWTEYNFSRFGALEQVKIIKKNGAEIYPEHSGTFVVFKNLEPGDLIQITGSTSWNTESELGIEFSYFQKMNFQSPVVSSRFEIAMPAGKKLVHKLHKLSGEEQVFEKDGYMHYKWEFKNLPKIIEEAAILDRTDLIAMVQVSTMKDWSKIVEWYKAKTYRKLEPNYEIREILDTIIKDGMNDEQKMIAIYNFITKEINYSFNTLLQSGYIPKNTEHTCSGGIGDCKDVATLMISMLKEVGIKAHYVLVKTNSYFHNETLPGLYFDHVISGVELEDEIRYIDLTTDFYPHYVLNENDVDAWALPITETSRKLIVLPNDELNPEKNKSIFEIEATLNKDKSLDFTVNGTFYGMEGGYFREVIHNKPKSDIKNEILKIVGRNVFENLELLEFDFTNSDEITKPFTATFNFKSEEFSDQVLDIHFFTIPFITGLSKDVALQSDKRYNTLFVNEITDVAPSTQKIKINFPKGRKLRILPKNVSIENEFGKYQLSFGKLNNGIEIIKNQSFKKNKIAVNEFEKFKEFYLQILKLDNMKIVLN